MLFCSIEFIIYFLPLFLIAYGLTPARYRNLTLIAGSLLFYTLGEPRYLPLLVGSAVINYFTARYLQPLEAESRKYAGKRKRLLYLALTGNVGMLVLFKTAPESFGLPAGISFYTFQAVSYLLDVYRGDLEAEKSFIKVLTYITMFPQLLSGPITRYDQIADRLSDRRFHAGTIQEGLKLFSLGLAAKVLLADRAAILWNEVQTTGVESITTPLAWIAALGYSMQIYFDFAGYSLMASGVARMLGFKLPENFREPYMAGSVREFYRRWHITLGRWFRDYVYIPLGGNRKGYARTVFNLLVVWILTAAWHGSTLNFMLWGLFLWFFIVLERTVEKAAKALRKRRTAGKAAEALQKRKTAGKAKQRHFGIFSHLYLWAVIPVTWMCFANEDFSQLKIYLGRMFGLLPGVNVNAADWKKAISNYGFLLLCCFVFCTPIVRRWYGKWKNSVIGYLVLILLFWLSVWRVIVAGENTFMYLRF